MKKVITYGSFDLFHEGHYNILKRAKALGDYLIVGVTTEHFDRMRGKLNLVDPIMTRIQNVKDTGFADEIIVEDHDGQKIEDIQKYGIDTFVLGSDWFGKFDYLKQYCNVIYLERTPNISSTVIRNNILRLIKLGIVGTGRIARRFIAETKFVSGVEAVAAYNPEKESLDKFVREYAIYSFSSGYESFLKCVDAVYIASPNETHADYVRRALQAGKHVLCEKPMTFTYQEAVDLYALAKQKGVVLMEGIRAAYLPGFQQLLTVASNGTIGKVCDIEACFTRLGEPTSREMSDARYGGAFMEYGSYTLLPIFKILGLDYEELRIDSILGNNGIDVFTKVQFKYPNALATSKTGAGVKSEGQLVIAGTKGYIIAQSPWWLIRSFDVRYEDANVVDHHEVSFVGNDGFRYEIAEFLVKINGTGGHDYKLTAEESIAMAKVVEEFMNIRREQQGF
ncbi:Gfo/Idh/MocA family oxidoreductase [Butyrivibrio sp. YAB3001]|uniref:Gfo/Idh/MocA family oxidoreductase n=1 Tax=Butyrivibrio sp. YAB3001 TaxID=1520812 RepID=UPI0008F63F3E|nr:Gfo/Idh/MocA family oxidoreductase [Butyrivibrio sp. YAB3001]SFC59675.1 glycerol-3-phosphate cytidylyltransferase [Butyrivibrio sp. YAB3001]